MISSSTDRSSTTATAPLRPWFRELDRYQWFVLVVCTLGWGFDCLDQQLFSLARQPAVTTLLGVSPGSPEIDKYSGYATSFLLIGRAIGGLRRPSTGGAFLLMKTPFDVFWMVPLMGFFQLSVFGGYAIYLPELFPTRLRSTGTSFCYNMARLASAAGPAMLGLLTSEVFTRSRGFEEPMRYAGLAMCGIFVLGLLVLPFLPETKGQPLPE